MADFDNGLPPNVDISDRKVVSVFSNLEDADTSIQKRIDAAYYETSESTDEFKSYGIDSVSFGVNDANKYNDVGHVLAVFVSTEFVDDENRVYYFK